MRRVCVSLALLLAITSAVFGEQSKVPKALGRLRFVAQQQAGCAGCAVLTSNDFTYLGAYYVNGTTPTNGWSTVDSRGLTIRYEPSDLTNPVHLVSAAYTGDGHSRPLYEWRDITPTIPGDQTDTSAYTEAPILKEYTGSYVGGDAVFRRTVLSQTSAELEYEGSAGPDYYGLWTDPTNSARVCWNYVGTYDMNGSNGIDNTTSYHYGCSALNYSAGTGVASGPWRVGGQGTKSVGGGMLTIPSWYANAYTSGRQLGLGCGNYGSITSTGDASMGPSITAVSTTPSADRATVTGTPVMGYWPYSGTGGNRMTRPNTITQFFDSAPQTEWTWTDYIGGCVWIDTGVRHGVAFVMGLASGPTGYLESDRHYAQGDTYWAIYNPMALTPVSGTARDMLQPSSTFQRRFPIAKTGPTTADAMYDCVTTYGGTISTTTSTNGVTYGTSTSATGARVNTASAHGLVGGERVGITGNTSSQYNGLWRVGDIVDADTFILYLPSGAATWTGAGGSGGLVQSLGNVSPNKCGQGYYPTGMAYDPTTRKLYVSSAAPGWPFIYVWQVRAD